jgi:hypothetical protein
MSTVRAQNLQGVLVPETNINPELFFKLTRRLTPIARTIGTFSGFGNTENIPMLQTGIIAGISIKVRGEVVIALPTGTAATTSKWPYDLLRAVRFTANGQSNLINVSGFHLKVRDIMSRGDLNDRGVSRGIGGASPGTATTQGTLSLNTDIWGLGQNVTAIPAATYAFELNYYVPISFDLVSLTGAVFAQTTSTDLNLQIDYATSAELFVLTGTATATIQNFQMQVQPVIFSIPQGPDGSPIVPDLSVFHSMIMSPNRSVALGDNEVRLVGQGIGRQMMRVWWLIRNGATQTPLAMSRVNYGNVAWRFGTNDTPEVLADGTHLAHFNERLFGNDLATSAGIGVFDFSSEYAFRDSVDQGAATELRLLFNIANGVVLANPTHEYVQEILFPGSVAGIA